MKKFKLKNKKGELVFSTNKVRNTIPKKNHHAKRVRDMMNEHKQAVMESYLESNIIH